MKFLTCGNSVYYSLSWILITLIFAAIPSDRSLHLDDIYQFPSLIYPFGTDSLGRSIFFRTAFAMRVSWILAMCTVAINLAIAIPYSILIAFCNEKVKRVLQKIIVSLASVPVVLQLLFIMAFVDRGIWPFIFLILIRGWVKLALSSSAALMTLSKEPFIVTVTHLGISRWSLFWNHLLPHLNSFIWITIGYEVISIINLEAVMSIMQLGIQEPAVSWGGLMRDAVFSGVCYPYKFIPLVIFVFTIFNLHFLLGKKDVRVR